MIVLRSNNYLVTGMEVKPWCADFVADAVFGKL